MSATSVGRVALIQLQIDFAHGEPVRYLTRYTPAYFASARKWNFDEPSTPENLVFAVDGNGHRSLARATLPKAIEYLTAEKGILALFWVTYARQYELIGEG